MEKEIRAFVPEHLCKFLQLGAVGEIFQVTSAGIYLRMGEQILLLCDAHWGILPIGIGMEDFEDAVLQLKPQQGQQIEVAENKLIFPNGTVQLTLRPSNKTVNCLPRRTLIRQAAEELVALGKSRGISMLVQPLILGQALAEEVKTNPYCMYAYPFFSKLVAAFDATDDFEIDSCIKKLLGLGLGLTPSADDVLLGMLYVFRALPQYCPEPAALFRACIARQCDLHTNQISAAYLKSIMAGAPFERMESVFRGLCGAELLDIQQLTQIGSSSGSEMLLGMLIALRICGYDVAQEELQ